MALAVIEAPTRLDIGGMMNTSLKRRMLASLDAEPMLVRETERLTAYVLGSSRARSRINTALSSIGSLGDPAGRGLDRT